MKWFDALKLRPQHRAVLLVLGALLSASGCGGGETLPTGSLSGTVTHNGEPVRNAMILFYSRETGAAASAVVAEDGTYEVVNPVRTGTYAVSVVPPPAENAAAGGTATEAAPPSDHPQIPAKYRSHESSPLSVTITEGSNQFDAALAD